MKKVFVLILMCMFFINVQAEELPTVVPHKVMVTNSEGTICYKDGSKTDKIIPYKTMLTVSYDINGSYINVVNDEYDCDVKFSDVSSNTQKFSIDNKNVEKITSIRAIVLPNTGLNMRVGPSVTYAKVITVPQNTLLTLTHKAGTYWYYTEYNGKIGWVTAMNNYLGFDNDKVLSNYEKTNIYNASASKILGTIPSNTEITDYIKLPINKNELKYYVNYNGIKGYIKDMLYKTDGTGKLKLVKDVEIKDEKGNPLKRMSSGSELEYTMVSDNSFYFGEKKALISLEDEDFEYINEAKPLIKEKGYLGEGIFGEEKADKLDVTPTPTVDDEKDKTENTTSSSLSTKDIVIICLLGGILLALIVLVVIKIMNGKKKNEFDDFAIKNDNTKEE